MNRNYGLRPSPLAQRYRRFTWGDVVATATAVAMVCWVVVEALHAIAGR